MPHQTRTRPQGNSSSSTVRKPVLLDTSEKSPVSVQPTKSVPRTSRISLFVVLPCLVINENQLKFREFCVPMHYVGTPAQREVAPRSDHSWGSRPPGKPGNAITIDESRLTNHVFSNSKLCRLSPIASHTKKTTSPFSNSKLVANFGLVFVPFRNRGLSAGLQPLPATLTRARFKLTDCKQRKSRFASSNKNGNSGNSPLRRAPAVPLGRESLLSSRGRRAREPLDHFAGQLLGFHPLRILRIVPGPHADLITLHRQGLLLEEIVAHHKTAPAEFRHCGLGQQLIAIRGRHEKPRLHIHQRNAENPVRFEKILNRQACRGKKRRRAIVEPGKIARVINNSGGIAISPLHQDPPLICQHFFRPLRLPEGVRERQAQAFKPPGTPRMSIIAPGSRPTRGRAGIKISP